MGEEKEKYSSIFDAASKMQAKKTQKKAIPKKEEEVEPPPAIKALTDEELGQAFDRCKKLHELIADTIQSAFAKKNITLHTLHNYFSLPRNFTSEQWRMIQEQKEEVEKQLQSLATHPAPTEEKPLQKPAPSKQKPKSMQVKSRWLPMK